MTSLNKTVRRVQLTLRQILELLLDNPLGHLWIRIFFWPVLEYVALPIVYAVLRCLGPLLARTPCWFRLFWENVILKISIVLNERIFLDIIFELVATFGIIAIGVRYDPQMRDDVLVFLRVGTCVKANGQWHEYYKANMGSANERDSENCFFPLALESGPNSIRRQQNDPFWSNDLNTRQLHEKIAQSCAFFSILCYQNAKIIQRCMENAPMLPNVSFYTVTTGPSDTDLFIFVDNNQKWAIFCFRGTEPETLTDWLTSVLVTRPTIFCKTTTRDDEPVKLVRSRYYEEMLSAIHQYKVESVVGSLPQGGRDMTGLELVTLLSQKKDCKIYFTGHSLGGGLATLMGAYMAASQQVQPAAIITFGSPPVAGSPAFLDWYNDPVKGVGQNRSWRFVNGNEFAPFAPPLPFTTTQVFYPVDKLILAQDLSNSSPTVSTYRQEKQELDQLFLRLELLSLIVDHNPVLTLQAIKGRRKIATSLTVKRN